MLRSVLSFPRLIGLVCVVALLHIVWFYRRPIVDLQTRGGRLRGVIGGGGGGQIGLGGKQDFSRTREAVAAGNETLGFGEILVISLDYRTDRRDALTLISSLSQLDLTILHGVTGNETAHSPVIPPDTKLELAELGCWRSHVNAWKHVVESGVETALILEDDADWHVNIKAQMSLLSQNLMRWGSPLRVQHGGWRMGNLNQTMDALTKDKRGLPVVGMGKGEGVAPYGLDWDMFWLGQCVQSNDVHGRIRPGFSYNDTAGAPALEQGHDFKEEMALHGVDFDAPDGRGVRIVAEASGPACTTGYAITRAGAHKLLYTIGYLGPNQAVDIQILQLVSRRELKSLWVVPPLISAWHLDWAYDSDTKGVTDAIRKMGYGSRPGRGHSEIGARSARREIERLWGLGDRKPPPEEEED